MLFICGDWCFFLRQRLFPLSCQCHVFFYGVKLDAYDFFNHMEGVGRGLGNFPPQICTNAFAPNFSILPLLYQPHVERPNFRSTLCPRARVMPTNSQRGHIKRLRRLHNVDRILKQISASRSRNLSSGFEVFLQRSIFFLHARCFPPLLVYIWFRIVYFLIFAPFLLHTIESILNYYCCRRSEKIQQKSEFWCIHAMAKPEVPGICLILFFNMWNKISQWFAKSSKQIRLQKNPALPDSWQENWWIIKEIPKNVWNIIRKTSCIFFPRIISLRYHPQGWACMFSERNTIHWAPLFSPSSFPSLQICRYVPDVSLPLFFTFLIFWVCCSTFQVRCW